jgi:hypothetical protein
VQGAGDQERDGPELAGARAGRRPSWLAPALIASWPPPALIASWPASALIADQDRDRELIAGDYCLFILKC